MKIDYLLLPYIKPYKAGYCSFTNHDSCTSRAICKAIVQGGLITDKTVIIDWCGHPNCNGFSTPSSIFMKIPSNEKPMKMSF